MMKALVIRFSSAGDILLASGAVRALKKAGYEVHFLTKKQYASLPALLGADKTLIFEKSKGALRGMLQKVRSEKYSAVIDLQNNYRSRYILQFSDAAKKSVYKKDILKRRLLVLFKWAEPEIKSVYNRYLEALRGIADEESIDSARQRPQRQTGAVKTVLIHTGARWPMKRWPFFGELITELKKISGIRIIVTGVKDEVDINDKMLYINDETVDNLIGKTSLEGLIANIAAADLFIGNDTVAAHAARLYNVPSIIFLGPTVQAFGFITDSDFKVLERQLACRPCHLHGGKYCMTGGFECMNRISAVEAAGAVRNIIKN
jgi:ADP-heptose:LPS heptosyltransferase